MGGDIINTTIFYSFLFLVYSVIVFFTVVSRENIRRKYNNLKKDYVSLQAKYENLKEKVNNGNNNTDTF